MPLKLTDIEPYFRNFLKSYNSDELLIEAIADLRLWLPALMDGDFLLNKKALSSKNTMGDICIVVYLYTHIDNIEDRKLQAYNTTLEIVAHLKNQAK